MKKLSKTATPKLPTILLKKCRAYTRIVEVNGCYYLQHSAWADSDRWINKYAGSLEHCLKKMHKEMRQFIYEHPEFIVGTIVC